MESGTSFACRETRTHKIVEISEQSHKQVLLPPGEGGAKRRMRVRRSDLPLLATLNYVAVRSQRITHRDAVERPFLFLRFHDAAISLSDAPYTRDIGNKENRLERC